MAILRCTLRFGDDARVTNQSDDHIFDDTRCIFPLAAFKNIAHADVCNIPYARTAVKGPS